MNNFVGKLDRHPCWPAPVNFLASSSKWDPGNMAYILGKIGPLPPPALPFLVLATLSNKTTLAEKQATQSSQAAVLVTFKLLKA